MNSKKMKLKTIKFSKVTRIDGQEHSVQSAGRARVVQVWYKRNFPKPGNWLSISENTAAMQ